MTTISVEIPKQYHTNEKTANFLQYYLEVAMKKGIEMVQDMQLQEELQHDEEFINLHDQFAEKV